MRDMIEFFKHYLTVRVTLLLVAVLVVASVSFAFVSATIGINLAAQLLLVGVIGGAFICLLVVGGFWTAVVVAAAVDRIRGARR